jgi:two-component system chemotaxis response regulator CheY
MPNVLIVDSAAFMRMMIKDIFTRNGFEIAGESENSPPANIDQWCTR